MDWIDEPVLLLLDTFAFNALLMKRHENRQHLLFLLPTSNSKLFRLSLLAFLLLLYSIHHNRLRSNDSVQELLAWVPSPSSIPPDVYGFKDRYGGLYTSALLWFGPESVGR